MDEASASASVVSSGLSSELLGYPSDARLLIVNCDDFGMYPAINAAVIESIEEGIAGSCSLMVQCPGAPQAMKLLSRRPQIPFGIHLTLVCEMPGIRWGSLIARERVPSLLDPAGKLFSPTPETVFEICWSGVSMGSGQQATGSHPAAQFHCYR
ncbi:ChbG/HpnK family deacetylase [Streptomyces anulatus]|uniref:ChbG/HpnK family deacetylase n=1 Tax=Streptomyces anulatus TaxID=1892 RepID=UPI003870518A